jgi:hypothetical protein
MASNGILLIQALSSVIIAVALLVLVIGGALVIAKLRQTHRKAEQLLDRVHAELTPLSRRLTAVAEDVQKITSSVRGEIERVNATIGAANERVHEAVALTERRLTEFNALLAVVQDEAEQLFVSTASTVRGIRRGAAFLGDRGGMDLASDELDAAEGLNTEADDLETQLASEEEGDGHDGSSESAAEALPAAPRVRSRTRNRRRA